MEFGPEIKVDGVRPDWLGSHEQIMLKCHDKYDEGQWFGDRSDWFGHEIYDNFKVSAIRLPANHPHYATPTPDERAVAPEMVARLVVLAKDVALDEIVSRTAFRTEARAIIAALEPVVDEDLVVARDDEAKASEANGFHDYAARTRAGDYDDGPVRQRYEGIKRGRALASRDTSRDVTPCTREQFEEACRI